MPQISHIKYKNVIEAGRIDADFFKPEFINAKDILEKKENIKFGTIIKTITDGKHGGVTFVDKGVLFIRNINIVDGTISINEPLYISEEESLESKRAELKPGNLLLTSIGKVGESAVVPEEIKRANINQNLVKIEIKDDYSPYYISVFLNSTYGKSQTTRYAAGNIQPILNYDNIKSIKIPEFPTEFQNKIEDIAKLSHDKKQHSKQLYQEAEDLLFTELGLKGHTISHTLTFSTTKKAVDEAGRYDADYFQPKYDELIEKIENYKGGWEQLINLTTYINNGNQPPYSENGNIKFFSQKWIKDKGIDYSFLESAEEPMVESSFFDEEKNKPSLVSKGDILYYSVGANLGYCHTYLADEKIAVGSFINIIRTDTSKFDSVAMGVILNSMIGRMQADRDKSGVAQPYIYAKNLRKFKIPLINSQLQKEISDKIKESFKLRNESKELLEQAKKMVEDEIEKE